MYVCQFVFVVDVVVAFVVDVDVVVVVVFVAECSPAEHSGGVHPV